MSILNQEGVLKDLEDFGKNVKSMSYESHYPVEKHSWAKPYQEMLPHIRTAYAATRRGDDIESVIRWLQTKIVTGIEANHLSLLLRAVTTGWAKLSEGEGGWQVVDNKIQFVSSVKQLNKRERSFR